MINKNKKSVSLWHTLKLISVLPVAWAERDEVSSKGGEVLLPEPDASGSGVWVLETAGSVVPLCSILCAVIKFVWPMFTPANELVVGAVLMLILEAGVQCDDASSFDTFKDGDSCSLTFSAISWFSGSTVFELGLDGPAPTL